MAWASQAKNNTSETIVVGIKPGISLVASKRLMTMDISLAAAGASTKNAATKISTLPVFTRLTPPPMENS
jgi:hypothetical protein